MSEDRELITEAMANYGWAVDTRDYALLRRTFTADTTIMYSRFGRPIEGIDELEAYLRSTLAPLDATQHLFANFVVTQDGREGHFRCVVQAQHVRGELRFTVGGSYEVDVVRDDGWRIARLDFWPTWLAGDPSVLEHVLEPEASADA
jgi:hypothetical protein